MVAYKLHTPSHQAVLILGDLPLNCGGAVVDVDASHALKPECCW